MKKKPFYDNKIDLQPSESRVLTTKALKPLPGWVARTGSTDINPSAPIETGAVTT